MRKLTILISFLFSVCFLKAQYGDQVPITINGVVCLLHYNGDNSVKHPLLVMIQGAGEFGTNPNAAVKNGTGWAIKNNKWNPDSVLNPITHQYESFIVLSTINVSQNVTPSFAAMDNIVTYMRNNYPIDTNCMAFTGLSAGGAMSANFGAHISNEGCCPIFYAFSQPKNILCAEISCSAEILDSSAGNPQPVQYLIADSIPIWGFSDSNDNRSLGLAIKHFALKAQRLAPSLGSMYSYFDNGGIHGGWNTFVYDASVRRVIPNSGGLSLNTYEWQLYKRRGAAPTPPTNTITTGTVNLSSFCVTTSSGQNFTVGYSSTGTWTNGNTFSVQMSGAGGGFTNFTIVGNSTTIASSGTINCTIPANTATGNRRFRVVSTQPTITGSQSALFPVNLAANQILPSASQVIFIGQSTNTLTVRDSSTATHKWYVDNVATTSTGTTFSTSTLTVGSHTIYCQSTFSCATVNSNIVNITVSPNASSKVYVTPNTTCGRYNGVHNFSAANPGDTIVLDHTILGDTVCELSFIHLHGTPNKHITIHAENGVVKSLAALTIADDCYYVDVNFGTQVGLPTASGSISLGHYGSKAYNVPYGLEVFGTLKQGGGFEVYGKDSNITASNIYVHNRGSSNTVAGYGIIIKNDPNYFGCDFSYDYPNMFKNITCHDFVFERIDQDVIYLGYSHGYNEGYSSVTCNGVVYYPRPAVLGSFLFYNMYCKNAGRSFVQAAQLVNGDFTFHDMYCENIGDGITGDQGAAFSFGMPDSSITIYNCGANRTYLHNLYTFGYGTINAYNNTFDSAGYCVDTTGVLRKNSGESNFAMFPATNTYNSKLQFIIKNNLFGANTQGAGGTTGANIRIDYGSSGGNYATSGNVICNNVGQTIYTGGLPVIYSNCVTNTVTVSALSSTNFCVTSTVGANVTINGTSTGTFNSGNTYSAYLSDATGNFAISTLLGSVNSTSNSFSISGIIPANLQTGNAYRIRIVASNPVTTGTQNNTPITISLANNSIAPTSTQNILTNTNGNTLTVTEGATPTSRQWYSNGIAISGQTGLTYIPNFTSAGTYSITCRSTYPCATITSNAVTINVTNPIVPTITVSTITGSPFCITATVGANVNVGFTSGGTYNVGNQYIAQLSNANGNFGSPVNIGTLTSTVNSGTIACVIPANIATSASYKIRIISTNPSVTSTNTRTIAVNLAANSIAPTATQNIYTGTNGNVLAATEQSTATSRQWQANGSNIAGQTGTTYTPNFSSAGTYVVRLQSVFACGTITSNTVTIIVTDAPPPPPDSVFTGSISGSPFCVTASVGASASIPYTSNGGTFNSGNIFTAQLSNINGSFASAINIGTLTSTANSGTISANIPVNTPTGTHYRIRVNSSNPSVVGQDNGSDLIINLAGNSVSPSATQNIFTNVNGNILTVSETSSATRVWFVNGVSTGITTATYTPNFATAGTYVIDCRSTFACGTITSNTITVIVSTPPAPVINTSTISGSPFCVTTSAGTSVSVPYTISGTFNAGNVFTAQLSDVNGTFASAINIGNVTSTSSGTISANIPANIPTGSGYNIRVVSSNPAIIGNDNGNNLIINLAANSIAPTNTQNIYTDSLGVQLTVTNQSSATVQWFYGTSSGTYPTNTGITTSTYTPTFNTANTYYVVAKSTFAGCGTITSNEVRINVTDIPPPPPDTICSTTQIQHDTPVVQTFRRITPYDSLVTTQKPFYFYIFGLKIRLPFFTTIVTDTLHLKDTTYYDSVVIIITPLHDTTICVITSAVHYKPYIYFDVAIKNKDDGYHNFDIDNRRRNGRRIGNRTDKIMD